MTWSNAPSILGDTPVGSVGFFAGAAAPAGWLIANGAAVSRATYSSLFAQIGTIYGSGDGSSTFNLPDLRSMFVRGWDSAGGTARGLDPARAYGSTQCASQIWNGLDTYSGTGGVRSGGEQAVAGGRPSGGHSRASSTPNTSDTGSQGVRPSNVAMLPCIKWQVTVAPPGSSTCGIPCQCLVGKGALVTATAADTPTALPVGNNGQALRANSLCALGMEWSNAGAVVSGIVNSGVAICMDNVKVQVSTSGCRGLQVGTVSGTACMRIQTAYCQSTNFETRPYSANFTTTALTISTWDFSVPGFVQNATIYYGVPATAAYCVSLQGGTGFNDNILCITRIV
jgi:hypothetical protein